MIQSVLIVDDVHEILPNGLISSGFDVHYRTDLDTAEIANYCRHFNIIGLVVRSKIFVSADFLKTVPSIQWIARAGAGMDNIDEKAAHLAGVHLFNSEDANANAVGEQAISALLALNTRLIKSNLEVRSGIWDREGNRGMEITGKTIGIIGYGNTGRAFARKLKGFDVSVLAYDKYRQFESDEVAKNADLEDIFYHSDIISLHIPLTEETREMVNLEFISNVRKSFVLINYSRGGILNPSDLDMALSSGKIYGFATDVWNTEAPWKSKDLDYSVFEKWKNNDMVIFTPHVAGWTVESYQKISEVLLRNIQTFRKLA